MNNSNAETHSSANYGSPESHVQAGHLVMISDNVRIFTEDINVIHKLLDDMNLDYSTKESHMANLLDLGDDVSFHDSNEMALDVVREFYTENGMILH